MKANLAWARARLEADAVAEVHVAATGDAATGRAATGDAATAGDTAALPAEDDSAPSGAEAAQPSADDSSVPARTAQGEPGWLAIGRHHLFFARRGSDLPAMIAGIGAVFIFVGAVVASAGQTTLGLTTLLLGVGAAGGAISWVAAFLSRRGVVAIPLDRVGKVLVGGHVWARDRGTLWDIEPEGVDARERVEAELAAAHSSVPEASAPPRDLSPLLLKVAGILSLTIAAVFLLTVITPDLILRTTLPAGGDMGSHHYIPQQLERFLPLRLSGWSDGWYAGFPMLHFYFPLPYTVIVMLQKVIGYGVAFRLVSLAGIFGYPFACYFCLRWMRLPQPVPMFGAAGGFVFVASETFTILGGNVASTMAGEFPFSISLTLSVFLIGLLWRGTRTGRGMVPTVAVLAAMVLCHVVPMIMVVPAGILMLVTRPRKMPRTTGFLVVATGLGVLVSALWLLPFLTRVDYTAHAAWIRDKFAWRLLFGGSACTGGCHDSTMLKLFVASAAIGLGIAGVRLLVATQKRLYDPASEAPTGEGAPFLFAAVAMFMAILLAILPEGAILNTRMLPFYYTMIVLGGAYGLGMLVRLIIVDVARSGTVMPAVAVMLAGAVVVFASGEIRFVRGWAEYNYKGYEVKTGYAEYQDFMNTVRTLPEGRVLWEYSARYEDYGTTRSLELLGYWTGKPSMEGLLVESSITSPFHFIMQNETSFTGTGAVPGLRYPSFDLARGRRHMELYDITWYIARSDDAKKKAKEEGLELFTTSGPFEIYRLDHPGMVSIPQQEPIVAPEHDWYAGGLDWFCFSSLERLAVFPQGEEGERLRALPHLPPPPEQVGEPRNDGYNGKSCGRGTHHLNVDLIELEPGRFLPRGHITVSRSTGGVIEFDTDQIGLPHLVATSWFPTWKAEGAEGPYLVSPSLMLVIPTQSHVVLREGRRGIDWLGLALSAVGVAGTVAVAMWQRRRGLLFVPPRPPATTAAADPQASEAGEETAVTLPADDEHPAQPPAGETPEVGSS